MFTSPLPPIFPQFKFQCAKRGIAAVIIKKLLTLRHNAINKGSYDKNIRHNTAAYGNIARHPP